MGLVAAEAMLRLFPEQEANERAFRALARFLELLDELEPGPGRPQADPLVLSFQLKLLWLSGYLPHVDQLRRLWRRDRARRLLAARRRRGLLQLRRTGALPLSHEGLLGIEGLLQRPLAEAHEAGLSERAAREALGVITASYEYHGGFRLRTLAF